MMGPPSRNLPAPRRTMSQHHPILLFYSYSHEDEALRNELATHLALMRRRGLIDDWHDRQILPGGRWADEIDAALDRADVVLLLISADFVASDYCFGIELTHALERQKAQLADVVPVIVRAVDDWQSAPFGHLQALPTDGKPVASWPNRDEAWTAVATGVRRLVQARRQTPLRRSRSPAPVEGESAAIEHAISTFAQHAQAAAVAKHLPVHADTGKQAGAQLADLSAPKTILWVDDNPENNRDEMNALFAIQIEIDVATSTEAAVERLRNREPVDLIITDWTRLPQANPRIPEGVRLLEYVRAEHSSIPRAVYHGEFRAAGAEERHRKARELGAIGATAYPDVLLNWCVEALGHRGVLHP
jgi:CheY-like chemotaxis protein